MLPTNTNINKKCVKIKSNNHMIMFVHDINSRKRSLALEVKNKSAFATGILFLVPF